MKMLLKNKRGFIHTLKLVSGFTLIELLVVVAIISLLSSIVFASLDTARKDAKDKAIIEAANQLNILMGLEYNETGSYCNLMPYLGPVAGVSGTSTCDKVGNFSGAYADKAKDICNNMYNNAKSASSSYDYRMRIALASQPLCASSFSWGIYLNNGKWYCVGSSGRGEYPSISGTSLPLNALGCYNNP